MTPRATAGNAPGALAPRRFAWLLHARGADLAAWPEADRAAAAALLRTCPESQRLLADALASEDTPAPEPEAAARIRATLRRALAPATPVARGLGWSALAACVAAGLYLGAASTPDTVADLPAGLPSVTAADPATVLATLEP